MAGFGFLPNLEALDMASGLFAFQFCTDLTILLDHHPPFRWLYHLPNCLQPLVMVFPMAPFSLITKRNPPAKSKQHAAQ